MALGGKTREGPRMINASQCHFDRSIIFTWWQHIALKRCFKSYVPPVQEKGSLVMQQRRRVDKNAGSLVNLDHRPALLACANGVRAFGEPIVEIIDPNATYAHRTAS